MRGLLMAGVVSAFAGTACRTSGSSGDDPGRITLHRLNNAEYNNTVHDLLGTELRPADDFPADERAFGFDNVADVQHLSTLQLELYEGAADALIADTLAVTTASTSQTFTLVGNTSFGNERDGGWFFFSGGDITFTYNAPLAGQYRISMPAWEQHAGTANAILALTIGSQPTVQIDVAAVEASPQTYSTTAVLPAGNTLITVSFANDFYDDVTGADRNLWVGPATVEGPLDAPPVDEIRRNAILICDQLGDATCQRSILDRFTRRAWRRPATSDEIDALLGVVGVAIGQGDDAEAGLRLALKQVLVSASFLFRIEVDPDPRSITPHPLTDHEIASRLSYFLWSTMPDDALFAAADGGQLQDPAALAAQVDRMLADPKAVALIDNFAGQWLFTRALGDQDPDYQLFPAYDDELEAAMREETRRYFQAFLDEDIPMDQFLTADFTYVNDRLATHYGLPLPGSTEMVRVSLAGSPRRGFLTQGSFLRVTSNPKRTSPVKRGKWVLDNLLCTPPAPPPPDVPDLPEEDIPTGSIREQLEAHQSNPVCASCHRLMDPIGFGLDNFDAIGAYRTEDRGFPIDATGTLFEDQAFANAIELGQVIAANPGVYRCMVEKLYTYTGRSPYRIESTEHIDELAAEFAAGGYRLRDLIVKVVTHPSFVLRRGEP
jgi:hypothetical protein